MEFMQVIAQTCAGSTKLPCKKLVQEETRRNRACQTCKYVPRSCRRDSWVTLHGEWGKVACTMVL